jgi:hypothetical protein
MLGCLHYEASQGGEEEEEEHRNTQVPRAEGPFFMCF